MRKFWGQVNSSMNSRECKYHSRRHFYPHLSWKLLKWMWKFVQANSVFLQDIPYLKEQQKKKKNKTKKVHILIRI